MAGCYGCCMQCNGDEMHDARQVQLSCQPGYMIQLDCTVSSGSCTVSWHYRVFTADSQLTRRKSFFSASRWGKLIWGTQGRRGATCHNPSCQLLRLHLDCERFPHQKDSRSPQYGESHRMLSETSCCLLNISQHVLIINGPRSPCLVNRRPHCRTGGVPDINRNTAQLSATCRSIGGALHEG